MVQQQQQTRVMQSCLSVDQILVPRKLILQGLCPQLTPVTRD